MFPIFSHLYAVSVQIIDGLPWTNQENGGIHLGNQLFRDRADHQTFQSTTMRGAHHHEVGIPFIRSNGDGFCNAIQAIFGFGLQHTGFDFQSFTDSRLGTLQ